MMKGRVYMSKQRILHFTIDIPCVICVKQCIWDYRVCEFDRLFLS